MKHALPPLDGFKVFESAARHLSFSRAAEELCITKGAISYQIRRLEREIDTPLFRRTVRQVYLTEAGQLLFQSVQKIFNDLQSTLSQLNPEPGYDVTIAATTYVAARWLSPRVAKFLELNPESTIRFDHNVNNQEFSLDNVDLAMIWGPCNADPDVATLMEIPMPLFPVCNVELANELLDQSDRLNNVTLLYEKRSQDLWLEWFGLGVLDNPVQVIEDANVRVQAAIDGQGLILADALMHAELDSGVLVAPFAKQITGYGYCLKSTAQSRSKETTASMIHWLSEVYDQTQ